MTKEMIIGVWNDYEAYPLATIKSVRDMVDNNSCVFSAEQLCNPKCNTNLTRFTYEPYTGLKIDWNEIYRLVKELK